MAGLLVASNRGPVAFADDGTSRRGGGGLVSALSAGGLPELVWVCAALSDADRRAVRAGRLELPVVMLDIDPVTFDRAYNRVANGALWFVDHLLHDLSRTPSWDARTRREWDAYTAYDAAFAAALAERADPGAAVLVQDYHLALVPRQLRALRPDLRIGHFSHTPWAPPELLQTLPDAVVHDLLTGMLGADALGFLSPRWAAAFTRCCVELLGAEPVEGGLAWDGRTIRVDVHALGVDAAELRARADEPDAVDRLAAVRELVGDRQLLLRIDRTELSKNIVRGLQAYAELLRRWPEHRGTVVHLAFAYPSRHDLPEYREYTAAVQRTAVAVNEEFGTAGWVPVHLEIRDDFARSLAAYRLADVLVVNPVRDGMNLVAKEGPVLSEAGVALVLSREAGAADELGADALLVNPFDLEQTAEAIHTALLMDPVERQARCDRLADAATALPPAAWLAAQLACLPNQTPDRNPRQAPTPPAGQAPTPPPPRS